MSDHLDTLLAANGEYAAEFGEKAKLPVRPSRRIAILTCMDARIDPAKLAGLSEGEAHIIRNAGGRASDDAIRSLVISHKLLGTREIFVIHHTGCGMQLIDNEIMGRLLSQSLETAVYEGGEWKDVGSKPGSNAGYEIDWLTFADLSESVLLDVQRIRTHPLIPSDVSVYGLIYDVQTGRLSILPEKLESASSANS